MTVGDGWQDWPALPDLFPTFVLRGVKTKRDAFLVDVDLNRLQSVGLTVITSIQT